MIYARGCGRYGAAVFLVFISFLCAAAQSGSSFSLQPLCNVVTLGAKGDNLTEDTAILQSAIDSCLTVLLPAPGAYLSRSLKLDAHDNLTIIIEAGATLVGWPNISSWGDMPLLYSDGYRNCSLSAVEDEVSLCPAPLFGFTLSGGGVVDGQGWRWWPYGKSIHRPILVGISRAEWAMFANVTLKDSPSFHLQVRGSDIEIAGVTVTAGEGCLGYASAPNTDGLNIGGQRIYIHDSHVTNGDDCIPTNIGWNNSDSDDILVERVVCECGTNGGVAIMANGAAVRNVVYRDMVVRSTNQGAGCKISEAYENVTGEFVNITWSNITIEQPRHAAVYVNTFQEDAGPGQCTPPSNASQRVHWLTGTNLSFVDIKATINSTNQVVAGCFACAPTRPCAGFVFNNVVVEDVALNPPQPPQYECSSMVDFSYDAATEPKPCGGSGASPTTS